MKIVPEKKQKEKLLNVAAEERQKKYLFSTKLKKGHKIFEFNTETKKINEAEIERIAYIDKKGEQRKRGNINKKENCLYIGALNQKNMERKLKKVGLL
jgi:hypothetical protein